MGRCRWWRTAEEASTDCEKEDGRQLPEKARDTPCTGALE